MNAMMMMMGRKNEETLWHFAVETIMMMTNVERASNIFFSFTCMLRCVYMYMLYARFITFDSVEWKLMSRVFDEAQHIIFISHAA